MDYYLWIKALHIIALVAWFAVLFYLPRLFVYHIENKDKIDFVNIVKIQEKKLYFFIGTPSFIITILTGAVMLILSPELFKSGMWLHIKLLFVIFVIIFHFDCGRNLIQLKHDIYNKSSRYYKIYNEIPTLFLFVIVFCAVLKF